MIWQIHNAIIQRLQAECIDAVSLSDPSRAAHVGIGDYQDDPEGKVVIGVYHNDPDEERWRDERDDDFGETGCGEFWARRYTVHVYTLPNEEDEAQAKEIFSLAMGRVMNALSDPLTGVVDPFGKESLIYHELDNAGHLPSGGEGSWINQGRVHLTCHTFRSP